MPIVAVKEPAVEREVPSPRPRVRPVLREPSPGPSPPAPEGGPEYRVGYKCPPLHTRFPKNTSGNPRGRPKGAKGLKTLVRELLTQKVRVRTASGLQTMTKMEAMLQKILEQAFSGNLRALQSFVLLYQQAVPDEADAPIAATSSSTIADLDDHDRAMLDHLRSTLSQELETRE